MKEIPNITDAELLIMKALWKKAPLTSSEIIEAVSKESTWNPKTIHTLISRLVKKGAVEAKKETLFYLYSPLVSQAELRKLETKSFLKKMYDGSLHLLISNFIKEEKLTNEQIDELKELLNKKSK